MADYYSENISLPYYRYVLYRMEKMNYFNVFISMT